MIEIFGEHCVEFEGEVMVGVDLLVLFNFNCICVVVLVRLEVELVIRGLVKLSVLWC